jgi:hypothetical protein
MNIGFWFDYDQTYTFSALFNEIRRRLPHASVSGFVLNDRYWSHAQENLPAGSHLVRLYALVNEGLNYKPSAEELRSFKEFDKTHHLARVAYSDRHLQNYTQDQLVGLYIFLLGKFRAYVREARPEVFYFNCVASHFAHLFYLVLVEQGVRVIIPFSFGFDDLVYLCDNPYLISEDIWQTYRRYRQGAQQPPADAAAWARQLIARIRDRQGAYQVATYVNAEVRRFRLPGPVAGMRYLYNHFRYYRTDPNLPTIRERLEEVFQARRNQAASKRFITPYERIRGTDFLFFPLHYEPEIATLVLSQYDHASVIDIVARQLPISWKLVVKDHPVMIGRRDHAYIRNIAERYPNVVFADPVLSAQQLVQDARAVLTLSGTVALEAMVLGKPVVITSPVRFGNFGLGTFSQDLINFGTVLDAALVKKDDEQDIVRMLASIWQHCDHFDVAEPLGKPSVLSADNIRRMADAVLRKAVPSPQFQHA